MIFLLQTQHAILVHGYRHGNSQQCWKRVYTSSAGSLQMCLGACGVMRWTMPTKHGRWPQTRTYHPDDPFALWQNPDGQRSLLDRFLTQLLKLQEAMTTATGRLMAERRTTFLRPFLLELQHELAEGGYGYDIPGEVS